MFQGVSMSMCIHVICQCAFMSMCRLVNFSVCKCFLCFSLSLSVCQYISVPICQCASMSVSVYQCSSVSVPMFSHQSAGCTSTVQEVLCNMSYLHLDILNGHFNWGEDDLLLVGHLQEHGAEPQAEWAARTTP